LAVTVFQDAVGQGKKSVEVAQQMIKGQKVDSHQWIPFELVTQQNMQHYSNKNP
ncbi:MAG: rhizopine-binding protein, partial [Pantoea agglomerans]